MVRHGKTTERGALLTAVLFFANLHASAAQDVRAVDSYITDTAPVAGVGIGEIVPGRMNSPRVTPGITVRSSNKDITRETEETISYVEDLLAGREDVSKGIRDNVFESDRRTVERPVISPSAGHHSGDVVRPATPSRVVPEAFVPPRRSQEVPPHNVGTGVVLDGGSRNNAAQKSPMRDRLNSESQFADGSRAVPHGSTRETAGSVAGGYLASSAGNARDRQQEDGASYVPRQHEAVSSFQDSYSSGKEEAARYPVPTTNRDTGTSSIARREPTTGGRDRNPAVDRPRVGLVSHPRDEVSGQEGDQRDYDIGNGSYDSDSLSSPVDDARRTVSSYGSNRETERDSGAGQYSRDGVRPSANREAERVNHNPLGAYDDRRHTSGDQTQETPVDLSWNAGEVEQPRDHVGAHTREESKDDSRGDWEVPGYRATTESTYRPTFVAGNSRPHSDEEDAYTRPEESHSGVDHLEETAFTSENRGVLGSSFSIYEEEYGEDIERAHSTRPAPKAQQQRQVTGAERRAARGPHPPSPCPSVFSYEGSRAGKERWYGVVLVSTDVTLTGIRLEIGLNKASDLLGTWLGEVSSKDNIKYTIWNGRRKVEPGPPLSIKIFVKYNGQENDPPRVRTIRLNGRQICPAEKGGPVIVPKPPVKPPSRPIPDTPRPVQRPTRPVRPETPKPSRPSQKPARPSDQSTTATELVDGVACGRIEVQPSPLITYGQLTSKGQWPWHAAIYQSKSTGLTYLCGGSLIGKKAIVTAAHCVSRRNIDRPIDSESIVVYLGKYHLHVWGEGGAQERQVLGIHVHPEYNSTDFRADIAILILSRPVEFSMFVKPICLWDRNRADLKEVEGHEGVVVGWGYDETGVITGDLMMAKMPVVSQETCIWSYPEFFSHFTSDRTFCAGFRNGTSVCNGDSGGGMVFPKSTGRGPHGSIVTWALRGIVSLSTSQENKRVCNTDHYVVFTDVAKFYDWIVKYLKNR